MGTTGGPHGSVGGARAPHAMSAEYERGGYDIMARVVRSRPFGWDALTVRPPVWGNCEVRACPKLFGK